jgi:hypothetical protein
MISFHERSIRFLLLRTIRIRMRVFVRGWIFLLFVVWHDPWYHHCNVVDPPLPIVVVAVTSLVGSDATSSRERHSSNDRRNQRRRKEALSYYELPTRILSSRIVDGTDVNSTKAFPYFAWSVGGDVW